MDDRDDETLSSQARSDGGGDVRIEMSEMTAKKKDEGEEDDGEEISTKEEKDGEEEEEEDTSTRGLRSRDVRARREKFGFNEIRLPEVSLLHLFLEEFTTSMAITLEIACLLSLALLDWADFGIVFGMIMCNACLGFHEKVNAKRSLEELTKGQEMKCVVKRDGKSEEIPVRDLVPGDLICLVGGMTVPADCTWVFGDIVPLNTKALTGESIPRKYGGHESDNPRKIMCGCEVVANTCYAVVTATGENTEIGKSSKQIAADKVNASSSVFEQTVMKIVRVIIGLAFADVSILIFIQGIVRGGFKDDWHDPILMALSIIVAAIPVALPLVMQVTMALGCATMARDHHAIVTKTSALQDVAAMTTLCSDKTGTLTTANMSIIVSGIRVFSGVDQATLLTFARLVSNPDKKDDPIDKAVIAAYEEVKKRNKDGGAIDMNISKFQKRDYESFNATVKRVTGTFVDETSGVKYVISKGIISKILDTKAGTIDEGRTQWRVKDLDTIGPRVRKIDEELSQQGYKTIALAASVGDEPMRFLGILPMIDPPRCDTKLIVGKIHDCGVGMKMITGDHKNIAAETARLVGLNTTILPGSESRGGDHVTKHRILEAGGFAEVTMSDKRNVVMTLQKDFNQVVGMMGDGVNDAPALSVANCGIAVDGATDAAKNAADMILTEPGLSAIYGAIVESRRIFARLNAYCCYRLAATIQIVAVLTVLVIGYDCEIKPLYIILLAFFNDITMTPISVDNADASAAPVRPTLASLLGMSVTMGAAETLASIVFFVLSKDFSMLDGVDENDTDDDNGCGEYLQAGMFLQMCLSAEFLIFSARAKGLFFLSRPSFALLASTMLGNVLVTVLCAEVEYFGGLSWRDVGVIWGFNLAVLCCVDACKMVYKLAFEHDTAGVIVVDDDDDDADAVGAKKRMVDKEEEENGESKSSVVAADSVSSFSSVDSKGNNEARRASQQSSIVRFLVDGGLDSPRDIDRSNPTLHWRTPNLNTIHVARQLSGPVRRRGIVLRRRGTQ